MLYQAIIITGLLIFALNLLLNLRSLKTPRRDSPVPEPAPLISVLVPARDEEANIAACLESLRQQDYPSFEIIVLDDNSSDGTADIAAGIASRDERIRIIRGEPLPNDWAGKPFACHQLARQARGSWYLFTDADTTHAPNMLRSLLAMAVEFRSSLLSGFPRQVASSLPQRVAIPVLYFIILSWMPLWWLQRSNKPRPSLAIGQLLLFPRDEYWRIGGHEAVKDRILEDVWLGIETVRSGGRHIAVDLSPVMSSNMYRGVGVMWLGFVRWIYSVASMSPLALVTLITAAYLFFLAPFYWLWKEIFMVSQPTGYGPLLLLQVIVIYGMRWLLDNRFRNPVVSTLLHPLGISFLFIAALYAGARRVVGAGVNWKRRLYNSESSVS